jgi:Tol biopolymer transport system component
VLKQIDLPHPYYFRELYLPQLTAGPSAVAWSPDSQSVVYSMAGSLWRQRLDSGLAEELTSGPGYDYQPDCSLDGRWVVYAKYDRDAVELWALDLQTKEAHALTTTGAVNLEPRVSPDGKKIVFVSTQYNRRFHIFTADFSGGRLSNIQRITGETRSSLPRYYYSVFDHEISPAWSPDGTAITYISNRGHIYGTGGIWRMKAQPGAEAREIYYEETNWKARPDWSPDGKRLVFASYAGRQYHQLSLLPSQGGDVMRFTYGEFDTVSPRWSPDDTKIAFISNRGGGTSLGVVSIPGGAQSEIVAKERHYLRPVGKVEIRVNDESGKPVPARISLTAADGRAYAPSDSWMHADDNFNRAERSFEAHYFHSRGKSVVTVPAGRVDVEVLRGFEYEFEKHSVEVAPQATATLAVRLKPLAIPEEAGTLWASGDVHVHMNYTGTYRNTPQHLVEQAEAEDLAVVENLIVNKEQRIPDISYFSSQPDPSSNSSTMLLHGQEFHTSYWGHLGLLNLSDHFLLPDYAAYANTAAASLWPTNADIADLAHAQKGVVGYVHPFDELPDPAKDVTLTNELPVDVALGKVDYIEVVGFSDHKSTAAVWYRLLNCGFHLPTAAGTDAMANYASLRGPVGLNRVYVGVPQNSSDIQMWLRALRSGRTFATNGPLLGFRMDDREPGAELKLPVDKTEVKFSAWLRSIVPIDHLQIVCNGEMVQELALSQSRMTSDISGRLHLPRSGWCLLRAWSEKAEHPILDLYPYATTSPVYVTVGDHPATSPQDAKFFIAWIDRLKDAANAHADWNSPAEKSSVLDLLSRARKVYEEQIK